MAKAIHLGPFRGTLNQPDYQLTAYRDGDASRPISRSRLDLRSVVSIQTTKAMSDLSGTFQIVLKDKRARNVLREMDVIRIRLKGHHSTAMTTVMKGVVDEVTPGGSAETSGSEEHTTITGRCPGKYLQINSLFLPVWDAAGALPTALTFGLGDVTQKATPSYKAGGTSPYDIFRYLVLNYVYGGHGVVGTAGTPAAKHWLDYHSRFARDLGFNIPFLQFNEDPVSTALQSMEVLGFTEAWVDELGRVVYRRPQWDAPVRYVLHTDAIGPNWSFPRTDVNTATYVEVIPAGDPGVSSATAQALRAGRAPVPSSYVKKANGKKTGLGKHISNEFIIDSDRQGKPTAAGRSNPWYQRQQRLGVRPQQIDSPLIVNQVQAQAQAEGLLRFHSRMDKGIQATIPGCPELRNGFTIRVHGQLEGLPIDRSGYIENVQHSYQEDPGGGSYTTTFTATHGRDAKDPFTGRPDAKWGEIALPTYNPGSVVNTPGGGVVDNSPGSKPKAADVGYPLASRGKLIGTPYVGTHAKAFNVAGGSDNWESENAVDIGVASGTAVFAVEDGTIGSQFGSLGAGGRFAGLRCHLETADNEWYYAHLSSFSPGIKPGVKLKQGDRIGSSGSANGVEHLHIACLVGHNPQDLLGWGTGS